MIFIYIIIGLYYFLNFIIFMYIHRKKTINLNKNFYSSSIDNLDINKKLLETNDSFIN